MVISLLIPYIVLSSFMPVLVFIFTHHTGVHTFPYTPYFVTNGDADIPVTVIHDVDVDVFERRRLPVTSNTSHQMKFTPLKTHHVLIVVQL